MADNEVENKSLHPICDCGLCTDPMPVCDCAICKECRDEQAALIGLYGADDDDLRFVLSEVHREQG